jgi:hypothetical protein
VRFAYAGLEVSPSPTGDRFFSFKTMASGSVREAVTPSGYSPADFFTPPA